MIQFYDSTDIGLIPKDATHLAAYHDGRYAVSQAQIRNTLPSVTQVRWITIANDPHSGIADFEQYNPVFNVQGMLRAWCAGRHALGMSTPIVYTDRANARLALERLDGLRAFYWITVIDPENRGAQHQWTADELAADLRDNWGAPIPASWIWACQWENTPGYDLSDLFLGWWA